jgi:hypothetical protein
MKAKICILIASICPIFAQAGDAPVNPYEGLAPESVFIMGFGWKEISQQCTKKEGFLECIPPDQALENWSEMLSTHYVTRSELDEEKSSSVQNLLDSFRKAKLSSYPGSKVSWQIIEKNEDNAMYEWILHEQHEDIPPQHEIVRMFLTKGFLHRVGFTKRQVQMSPKEREQRLTILKQQTFVVSDTQLAFLLGRG